MKVAENNKNLTVFSRAEVCIAVDQDQNLTIYLQMSPSEHDDTAFNKVEEHNESY
jgi:hypothetical protein